MAEAIWMQHSASHVPVTVLFGAIHVGGCSYSPRRVEALVAPPPCAINGPGEDAVGLRHQGLPQVCVPFLRGDGLIERHKEESTPDSQVGPSDGWLVVADQHGGVRWHPFLVVTPV